MLRTAYRSLPTASSARSPPAGRSLCRSWTDILGKPTEDRIEQLTCDRESGLSLSGARFFGLARIAKHPGVIRQRNCTLDDGLELRFHHEALLAEFLEIVGLAKRLSMP